MPTATATLNTLGGVVVDTGVSVASTVLTTYWPYFLVIGVLVGLVFLVKRFVRIGTKR